MFALVAASWHGSQRPELLRSWLTDVIGYRWHEGDPERQSEDAIASFLRENDWSAGSVDRFLYEWEMLSDRQRQEASNTPAFESFAESLRARASEERAFAEAGNKEAPAVLPLERFAQRLGVSSGPLAGGGEPELPKENRR